MKDSVLVLLSGGIDSTACLDFYLSQNANVTALFLDYGQASASHEVVSAVRVAEHYRVALNLATIVGATPKTSGEVFGRNALLLHFALMEWGPSATGIIAIGIHAGTQYFDCSPSFTAVMQSVFDSYTGGRLLIGTPFLSWSKKDIWDYCRLHRVPLSQTYSCELGNSQPCGKCLSCRDLEILSACT